MLRYQMTSPKMASACSLETCGTDDFQVVRRKKGKRRQKQLNSSHGTSFDIIDDSHVDLESLKRRVNKCRDELLATEFYANLLKTLERAVDSAKESTYNDTTDVTSVAAVNSSTDNTETESNIDSTYNDTTTDVTSVAAVNSSTDNTETESNIDSTYNDTTTDVTSVAAVNSSTDNTETESNIDSTYNDTTTDVTSVAAVNSSTDNTETESNIDSTYNDTTTDVTSVAAVNSSTDNTETESNIDSTYNDTTTDVTSVAAVNSSTDNTETESNIDSTYNDTTTDVTSVAAVNSSTDNTETESNIDSTYNDTTTDVTSVAAVNSSTDNTETESNIDSTYNDTTTDVTSVAAVNSSTDNTETESNIDRRSRGEHTPETNHGKSSMPRDVRMLVYGLGNFASCVIARYQLALVLALRQHCQVSTSKCEVYDPKFSELETGMLQDLGCSVLQQNEEGKRRMQGVTIVLMPHCGKALFNNLLWANWSTRQLQRMVVMGNSFSNMEDSIPERLWKKHINYVSLISPHCTEEAVNNTFTHTDIFNDLSIHWFPASRLLQLPAHTWSHAPQPVYDATDLEIIVNSSS